MTISQRITALPPAPDPAVHARNEFAQVAAASVLAQRALPPELNAFATQANDLADEVNVRATAAIAAAATATVQAQAALAVAGVLAFNPSKNYAAGESAYSLINGQTYRRIAAGVSTTNPANDQANWRLLSGNDINGAFVPIVVTGTVIDLSLGSYFMSTKAANTTFTFINVPAGGASFTLSLTLTASVVIGFPASVKWPSNIPPDMQANKLHKLMFVSENGDARFDASAVTNYDI